MDAEVVVVGAGTVGAAIAYGLARRGVQTLLLDGADRDLRAAVSNFGLVWAQGKGTGLPAYQKLTLESVDAWNSFQEELTDVSSIDLQYESQGGLTICLGEEDFEKRRVKLLRLHNQLGGADADWEMVDRRELADLMPGVEFGFEVTGASYGRRDGHANPLRLLSALQDAFVRLGGEIRRGFKVEHIGSDGRGGLNLEGPRERIHAPRLVIAAGLGSKALAAQVDLDLPLRAQRGQILVTERVRPFLRLPCSGLRQTREGTIMMGTTHEESGEDLTATVEAAAQLGFKAVRRIPALGRAKLVRQWAGLRIMTPDSYPIYMQSPTHPSAFVALCHSGVTLAAFHAGRFAAAVAAGSLGDDLAPFHARRFDVPQTA